MYTCVRFCLSVYIHVEGELISGRESGQCKISSYRKLELFRLCHLNEKKNEFNKLRVFSCQSYMPADKCKYYCYQI